MLYNLDKIVKSEDTVRVIIARIHSTAIDIHDLPVQADLLLANVSTLGLRGRPELHLSVLFCYADSLFEDVQYRRALVSVSMERD